VPTFAHFCPLLPTFAHFGSFRLIHNDDDATHHPSPKWTKTRYIDGGGKHCVFGDWVELDWTQEMVDDLQSLLHGNSGGGEATVIETSDIVSVLSKVNVLFPDTIIFFRHDFVFHLLTIFF
tara:strand:- start:176 stop:538 length:363 start_codon:yes stop_codon:yes gene_type:complete